MKNLITAAQRSDKGYLSEHARGLNNVGLSVKELRVLNNEVPNNRRVHELSKSSALVFKEMRRSGNFCRISVNGFLK